MQSHFTTLDWIVLVTYFCGVLALGFAFWKRSDSSEQFTAGGRSLPGWLCGLSIFATYLSSISYLALPGKAFVDNWSPFVFSLSLPLATWIAVRWFLPYYRNSQEVSAYAFLEKRFGTWARVFASTFYLVFQIARMGVVMYLMALPMAVIFGWDMRLVIVATGLIVTVYAFVGGVVAVIWADAVQAIVLLVGAVIALGVILAGLPEGPQQVWEFAHADPQHSKFSLGNFDITQVGQATFWVMLVYGLFENLKNFGIDQSYVQRYIASSSDVEARRSVWLGGLLYIPVSALFFLIGTSLFAFYHTHDSELPEVRQIVARQQLLQQGVYPSYITSDDGQQRYAPEYEQRLLTAAAGLEDKKIGDSVFPHFIAKHLPPGLTGLLIAAVFAAGMSTVSTSLNSSATLVMSDFYQRFVNPSATDRQQMHVLHGSTIAWGVLGTLMALILVRLTNSALDIWWTMSSVLGSGLIGLFLLGMINHRAGNRAAAIGVSGGILVILWMVLSQLSAWPAALSNFRSPFHNYLVIVIGTSVIVALGSFAARTWPRRK